MVCFKLLFLHYLVRGLMKQITVFQFFYSSRDNSPIVVQTYNCSIAINNTKNFTQRKNNVQMNLRNYHPTQILLHIQQDYIHKFIKGRKK